MNTEILKTSIIGRVEPHIYAFETCSVPNYLKIGDTYRPVYKRLDEWRRYYKNLRECFNESAVIEDKYFRDYSVHSYVESVIGRQRIKDSDFAEGLYRSNEFFRDAQISDIRQAIDAIRHSYESKDGAYSFYSLDNIQSREELDAPVEPVYKELRDNQRQVVENFRAAIKKGRKKLLMYAVMRFGKSITAMSCAEAMEKCQIVVIVSAKADVKSSWEDTIKYVKNFEDFDFVNSENFMANPNLISQARTAGRKLAICLTLQDISTTKIKERYKELFNKTKIDLLIVDETHFGARAEHYGRVLQQDPQAKKETDEDEKEETLENLLNTVHTLNSRVQLHLSGTPYRILMGNEFSKEDIICQCTYPDIIEAGAQWDADNLDTKEEWENPYYGFPHMLRFAFNFNKSSLKKLEQLKASGKEFAFEALFETYKAQDGSIRFVNEVEVLDLMKAINSGDEDENILSFLGNSHIKEGELCHHIIMVLPRRAACDAMQKLISSHQEIKPLSEYITINAAGTVNRVKKLSQIKSIITNSEKNRKKTLTLTVNRMLTGTTVPEWDTMIFLKGTSSPQEYDQATYRLQNPYVVEYKNEEGKVVKRNMKPQTLLVDFSPERIFFLQEQRAFYNCANSHRLGNNWIEEEITRELSISPILFVNKDKLQEVTAVDIIDKLRQYSRDRSILDEARQIGPDYSLKDDKVLYEEIMRYAAIDSNNIMKTKAHEGEKTEADVPNNDSTIDQKDKNKNKKEEQKEPDNYEKRLATFFSHILFFAYLTKDKVRNLADILTVSNSKDNKRIAKHLDLDFSIIKRLTAKMNPSRRELLEFKIANINDLSHDDTKDPTEKVDQAMKQFGRWSESEIVTPANIADDMVALITKDRITKEFRILDIASKEGEFANALFKRFGEKVRYSIFSLPTSGVAYEFTRKVYEEIGLPIQNIISDFNSYSLVGKDKDKYIKRLKDMNFNAIVGNPPYQEGVNKEPIYHHFIDFCTHSEFSTLIHPGRFLFNAGKTPKIWNQKMLNDEHYSVVNFWKKSDEVFDSVDIKGGVAVTLWDKDNNIGPIGTFVLHEELHAIHENVEALGEGSFSQLVYSRDLYQLTETFYKEHPELEGRQSKGHRFDLGTTVFALFPEVFFDKKPAEDGYAYVVGRDNDTRIGKWIKKDYLKLPDNFETYKVVLPKSNGSGHFGEQLSSPFVADPFHAQNTTFLSIGKFDTAQEAEACLKYIKTKFVRCLLGILKVTQDNPKSVWRAVPIQNFTPESEIDWNLSINEIDAALYAKYNLTPDEIDFIENNVRPME